MIHKYTYTSINAQVFVKLFSNYFSEHKKWLPEKTTPKLRCMKKRLKMTLLNEVKVTLFCSNYVV